jgi:spermidine synthase
MSTRGSDTAPVPFIVDNGSSRALHFGDNAVQSVMLTQDPDCLALEYTRMMMAFLLFNRVPRHIGMIGLGGGSQLKFCHRHLPQTRISVAEISAQVLSMRTLFAIPAEDERLSIELADGAEFIRRQRQLDVLIVDGYEYGGLSKKLSTSTFYRHCFQALSDPGMVLFNFLPQDESSDEHAQELADVFGDCRSFTDVEGYNTVVAAFRGKPELMAFAVPADWAGANELQATLDRLCRQSG